jgi:hypothetical protein
MDASKFFAMLMIVAGILAFGYGGATYLKEARQIADGSLLVPAGERQHVTFPVWMGIGVLLTGGLLLCVGKKARGLVPP